MYACIALSANGREGGEYKLLPGGPSNGNDKETKGSAKEEVSVLLEADLHLA